MYVFDISFVDQKTETYYLADRSNAVVDVVDADTGTFTKQIAAVHPGRTALSQPSLGYSSPTRTAVSSRSTCATTRR